MPRHEQRIRNESCISYMIIYITKYYKIKNITKYVIKYIIKYVICFCILLLHVTERHVNVRARLLAWENRPRAAHA